MIQQGNGEKDQMRLNLTRERARSQIIENLIAAGVLLRDEAVRYGKVLDSFDNIQLTRVLVVSHQLRAEVGEILT